jgi:hypothetical protein
MGAISPPLRKQLESAVLAGRRAAEGASRSALDGLGVFAELRPEHLDDEQAALRNGLRAKWRQLGSDRELLIAGCAYEQWHRLLFARFLAENKLLLHPLFRAPVTLEDCEELAAGLREPDAWAVAARFAAEILPGIFRLDDPCVRLRLAPEGRYALEKVITGLPTEVFAADDALGWVYQFWQKDKKDEINASERKIGGADLGPVTQLFTENYMVRFLLENSLGAWWASRRPDSPLVKGFEYLRVDDDCKPAGGSFDTWPEHVAEVTVMDPCCGSGHFLVEAFSMLWQMRAEDEALSPIDAQDAVLRDNLFGLELDARCVQIAMFAMALQAWKSGGGWRQLPVPNIACSGVPVNAPVDEWKRLAAGDFRLENALNRLHALFRDSDTLGSLISPRRTAEWADQTGANRSFDDVDWGIVAPLLERAVEEETSDPASVVIGEAAAAAGRAAAILTRRFTLVTTNPPWLQRTRQSAKLQQFGDTFHRSCEGELALIFLERCRDLAIDGGAVAVVAPQQWLELTTYRAFREHTLEHHTPKIVVALGAQAFSTPMHPGNRTAMHVEDQLLRSEGLCRFLTLDASLKTIDKPTALKTTPLVTVGMRELKTNPESRIVPLAFGSTSLLSEYAYSYAGVQSHDSLRFIRRFWELADWIGGSWVALQSNVSTTSAYAGRESVYFWEEGRGVLARLQAEHPGYMKSLYFRGDKAWGRRGVAIGQMHRLECTLYTGEAFDNNTAVIIPNDANDLGAVWQFCKSGELNRLVRMIDSKMGVTNATLTKVPFDCHRWREVADKAGPLPTPGSDDPAQWLFAGRPDVSTAPLQVAVARLLGYRWPEQSEYDSLDAFSDADGIVCLPSVAGEAAAAERLQQVLALAFGDVWSPAKAKELLEKAGSKKKNLNDWLQDEFFKQHCAAFGNRPFVWHIWDGRKDGFSALLNYHRLDRQMLEKLTYTYLGQDWSERQRAGVRDDVAGAEARLAAAVELQGKLEAILEGEKPFDIYVRWKQVYEQPLGWEPDLNDGVRLNIRPFVEAGVLRWPFNIHWHKDRGKNPDGSERYNDRHYALAEKRQARA